MDHLEQLKCAEVFRTKHGSFLFYCEFCLTTVKTYELFTEHMEAHFVGTLPQNVDELSYPYVSVKSEDHFLLSEPLSPLNEGHYESDSNDEQLHPKQELVDYDAWFSADIEVDEIWPDEISDLDLLEQVIHMENYENNKNQKLIVNTQRDLAHKLLRKQNVLSKKKFRSSSNHKKRQDELSEKKPPADDNTVNASPLLYDLPKPFYRCPASHYCNKRLKFWSMEEMEEHYKNAHVEIECDVCHRQFASFLNMVRHRRTHNRTFECDICHKMYPNYQGVKIHMVSHSGYKEFECKECNEAFVYRKDLLEHQRWHVGESGKRYICEVCGVLFRTLTQLRDHTKVVHLNIYDEQCPKCDKKFKMKRKMLLHYQRIHTDERPWTCRRGCSMTFRNADTRAAHEKRVHFVKVIIKN